MSISTTTRTSGQGDSRGDQLDYDSVEFDIDDDNFRFLELGFDLDLFERMKEAPFIRLRDKIVFTLFTANFGILSYFSGGKQWVLPWLFTFKYPLLVFFRFYSYSRNHWQYFLLDFCYYANLLLLLYLWVFPDNHTIFIMTFCVVHGPLAVAVPLFRNSLVFHSIDKTTSAFIHVSPILVTFAARWYLNPDTDFALHVCKKHFADGQDDCSTTLMETFVYPVAFFSGHMLFYYVIVHIILKKSIDNNPYALTTFRYLVEHNPKSIIAKAANMLGHRYARVTFSVQYCIFAAITILPTYLLYHNFWLNMVYDGLIILILIWNGANFYIEVFSRKYEGVAKEIRRRKSELKASSSTE